MKNFIQISLCVVGLSMSSCTSYMKDGLDLTTDESFWRTETQKQQGQKPLDVKKAKQIGLAMNPELMKARVKYKASDQVKNEAGWWNDPEVSWETLRILGDSPEKYALGGGLGFTIPLSGVPKLEEKIASQFAEADYWAVKQQEQQVMADIERAMQELGVLEQRQRVLQGRADELKAEDKLFTGLVSAGELAYSMQQKANQRLSAAQRDIDESRRQQLEKKQELIRLMGLHPNAGHVLRFSTPGMDSLPAGKKEATPVHLLRAPQLLQQLAQHEVSDLSLQMEIRKQYPDLKVDPTYSKEEGYNRVGGGVSFSIPLWNRNRQAVAEADGARNVSRSETVSLWRDLLTKTQQAQSTQNMIRQQYGLEQQRLQKAKQQVVLLEKLYKEGESSLDELSEARQQVLESRLAQLNLIQSYIEQQAVLNALLNDTL